VLHPLPALARSTSLQFFPVLTTLVLENPLKSGGRNGESQPLVCIQRLYDKTCQTSWQPAGARKAQTGIKPGTCGHSLQAKLREQR
jgi:hypothetical protein